MVKGLVKGIKDNSIAQELGIAIGDIVRKINNEHLGDIIDFMIAIADDYVEIEIEKPNGEVIIYEIDKDYNEEIGLIFDPPTIEPIRECQNNCVFCFINQMPNHLRSTLYLKDDDYRLSFLSGSYITGTNLRDKDINRIINYNLSPLFISVHQTGKGRDKLLGRKKPFSITNFLDKLVKGNISFHTQIVIVPGLNDGTVLRQTLEDLHRYIPHILSIAIVPVGLTKHRSNLAEIPPLTKYHALDIVKIANQFNNKKIVFVADEIIAMAELDLPSEEYYQGYLQLENGIGMLRLFYDEFDNALSLNSDIITKTNFKKKHILITGTLAAKYIEMMVSKIKSINNSFNYKVLPVVNDFFGNTVSVSGLLVGQDIMKELDLINDKNVVVYLPRNSLNFDNELFLDDIKLSELRNKYEFPIRVIELDGSELLLTILDKEVK